MKICRKLMFLTAAAAITALAETIPVNDLAPYDNTIKDDPYWCTTNHPGRTAEAQTCAMTDGFDSKSCSVVCVTLESFSSEKLGCLIIVR